MRPRLLVIDDEPALGEYLASVARDSGWQVDVTSSDRRFRESFIENPPALVVLDLGMPGMDGVELLRFLAEQDHRAPVLIVSGFDRRVIESAFRLGEALGLDMAGPLEKPVRAKVLENELDRLRSSIAA